MKRNLLLLLVSVAAVSAQEGSIVARGNPGDAGLFANGKYLGPASRFTVPEKYMLEPGEYEVVLRDPRYEEFTTKITIAPKKKTTIKYSLTKLPEPQGPFGTLRLGGDGTASFMSVAAGDTGAVYLNNKFYGYVDELNNPNGGLLLPVGTYKLSIRNSSFDMERDVTIQADTETLVPLIKQ